MTFVSWTSKFFGVSRLPGALWRKIYQLQLKGFAAIIEILNKCWEIVGYLSIWRPYFWEICQKHTRMSNCSHINKKWRKATVIFSELTRTNQIHNKQLQSNKKNQRKTVHFLSLEKNKLVETAEDYRKFRTSVFSVFCPYLHQHY